MDNYWKSFWTKHAEITINKDLQCQVLRTLEKKPISEDEFKGILNYVEENMKITKSDEILDLCCGNGLFATSFSSKCKRVVVVDFSKELIAQVDVNMHRNITPFVGDIRNINFKEGVFDKVLLYAGLQYLSYKDTILLFEKVIKWLRDDGIFYIGDIPDMEKIWFFYNSEERERIYFESMKNEKPLIGTWFTKSWLVKLGKYVNCKEIGILSQRNEFPYSHYRFDMFLKR